MNWDAIGAVGEAVSALALVLVLVQLRHTREEMQRSANQARIDGARSLWVLTATNSDLASIWVRAHTAACDAPRPFAQYLIDLGLTEVEARQFFANQMAIWINTQMSIESLGRLSFGLKKEVRRAVLNNYGPTNNLGSKWFQMARGGLNPEAVRYIDNVLAQLT